MASQIQQKYFQRGYSQKLKKKIDKETLKGYGAVVFNALGPHNEFRTDTMAKGLSVCEKINKQCLEKILTQKVLLKSFIVAQQKTQRRISWQECQCDHYYQQALILRLAQLEIYYGALYKIQNSFNWLKTINHQPVMQQKSLYD